MIKDEDFLDADYEEDIYGSEELVDELMEDDEIDPNEDSFLKGYDNDLDQKIHRDDYEDTFLCPNCGKVLKTNALICNACRYDLQKPIIT